MTFWTRQKKCEFLVLHERGYSLEVISKEMKLSLEAIVEQAKILGISVPTYPFWKLYGHKKPVGLVAMYNIRCRILGFKSPFDFARALNVPPEYVARLDAGQRPNFLDKQKIRTLAEDRGLHWDDHWFDNPRAKPIRRLEVA